MQPTEYRRFASHGSLYLRFPDGRRTRLYINLEAALRAAARGELYDELTYTQMTTVNHARPRTARRPLTRRAKGAA